MGKLYLAFGVSGLLRLFGYATEPLLDAGAIHGVVGERERVTQAADPGQPLKIVTWNIERGTQYDSILTALRALDADVVLLQEVDRDCRRTRYRDIAADLAAALGMNWVAAGEFQEIGEGRPGRPAITGQATLSRFPIESADVLSFAAQDRWRWRLNPVQPRRGGRIALRARTGGITVINTHIESGADEGVKNRQIAELVDAQSRDHAVQLPTVIGGDFNNGPLLRSPIFGSLTSAEFKDALADVDPRGPTSFGQPHPIDWIFVRNLSPLRGRVVEVLHASDHFPVVAALTVAPSISRR